MRTSRGRVITAPATYRDDSPEPASPSYADGGGEWAAEHGGAGYGWQPHAGPRTERAAAARRSADPAAASSSWGSGGTAGADRQQAGPALEEWEEAELALLSPESQKRERRRIANRDCARRIRQRQTELLAELTASVEALQADNNRLLATLTEVTRCWRDTTLENCELRSQLALLQAGGSGSGGSRSIGSGGSGSDLGSPGEGLGGLGRLGLHSPPGWGGGGSPMLL